MDELQQQVPGVALRVRSPFKLAELDLLDEMEKADWTGIDAPFGWPQPMLAAIAHYTATDQWPIGTTPERMRYRRTDWFVHDTIKAERQQSVWPLSVSSDRIAVCAWR
jgi:hypothetical protein